MKKLIVIFTVMVFGTSIIWRISTEDVRVTNSGESLKQKKISKIEHDIAEKSSDLKDQLDDRLIHLAHEIAPPSETELEENWENEYGCYLLANDCQFAMLNAKSYEEALWMRRKGYPSMSTLAMLDDLSGSDLLKLSEYGNSDAKKLLAMDALYKNIADKARIYARSSIAHGGLKETFGYRLLAKSYLISQDKINASINFKIASILGDSEATAEYRRITSGTAASVIDNHNRMAYGYLDAWIQTPVSDWTNDPRPNGDGG